MRILAIIPIRAGSKRIVGKNTKLLNGIPMWEYTMKAAFDSEVSDIIIVTDVESICASPYAVTGEPGIFADNTKMIDVIQHALSQYHGHADAIMLLQPTSPLRGTHHINKAIQLFEESGASSLFSGCYIDIKPELEPFDKTRPKHFQRNGAIFIATTELISEGRIWGSDVVKYEMEKRCSVDVDDIDDWLMAEALIKGGILED